MALQTSHTGLVFFLRLEELIYVLKENYASYRVKPERPAQEPAGGYSEDSLTKAINDSMDNFANFIFTQMFKVAAPENVRRLLSHKDQTRLTVEEAYKIYFSDHRLEMIKKSTPVHAVTEEPDNSHNDQQDVAAFRPQQRTSVKFQQGQQSSKGSKLQVQLQRQQLSELQPVQSAQIQRFQKLSILCLLQNNESHSRRMP